MDIMKRKNKSLNHARINQKHPLMGVISETTLGLANSNQRNLLSSAHPSYGRMQEM